MSPREQDEDVLGVSAVLRPLPEAYLLVDLRGIIRYANPAAEQLVARPSGSLGGADLAQLLERPGTLAKTLDRWRRTSSFRPAALQLSGGRRVRCDGARMSRPALLLLWLRDVDQARLPFLRVNDRVDTGNLRELSRRLERTVAELREANRRLTAANEEIQQYARAVAHDIRTPLFAIQGLAQLLAEDGHVDTPGADYVRLILESTRRLTETTDALLDVARLEPLPTAGGVADTAGVLDEVLEELGTEVRTVGAEVCVGELLPVAVDELALQQVLHNLVGNSLQHAPVEGRPLRIEVSSRPVGSDVEVMVCDDGAGIDGDDPERLFDLFHRSGRARRIRGLGVGLAACRKIVNAWGGTIACKPIPGPGVCFVFRAPAANGHAPSRRSEGVPTRSTAVR